MTAKISESSASIEQSQRLTGYHVFLALVAFCGWASASMDSSLFNFTGPIMMKEFGFNLQTVSNIVALGFSSAVVLSFVVGPLSDYWGRKLMFQWILIITTVGSLLTAFSWNTESLYFFRTLATGAAYAEYGVVATILIESVPAKHRGWLVGIMAAGWPAGIALATSISLLAIPIWGWRGAFVIGAIPALLVLIIHFFVKESERYTELAELRQQGNQDSSIHNSHKINRDEAVKFTYAQLFQGELLKNTILIWLYISAIIGAYGLLIWFGPYWMSDILGLDLEASTKLVGIGSYVSIAGYISCGWLSSKIGVRESSSIYILIAIILVIYMTKFSTGYSGFAFAYVLWNFFGVGIWGVMPRLFTESFPTRARGTGSCINSASTWFTWAIVSVSASSLLQNLGFSTSIFWAGVILYPLALIPLWLIRRIPASAELEEYIQ